MITPEDLKKYPYNLLVDAYQVGPTQISTFRKSIIGDPVSVIDKVIYAIVDKYPEQHKSSCRHAVNAILDHYRYGEPVKQSCKENRVSYKTYQKVQSSIFTVLNHRDIRSYILRGDSR